MRGDFIDVRKATLTRLFPFDKIKKEEQKGRLDFLFMALRIYRKHLFPYARDLAMINPHR